MGTETEYRYIFTRLALQDIDETLKYISDELYNAPAAADLLNKIEAAISNICLFPLGFPDCSVYLISDSSIRHCLVDNYTLIYRVNTENKSLTILRFCYGRMDSKNIKI